MTTAQGSRAESRAKQIRAIKEVAARQLADKGVSGLSLREVSREMGMVSSALYRYFATRDELLTALIYDAYNDLGASVERAEARITRADTRARWRATCNAVRRWAKANPNEYALLYGTPVPGYRAPNITIAAATRVAAVMGKILNDDHEFHPTRRRASAQLNVRSYLEAESLALVMPSVPPEEYVRALTVWTHVFGFVSFELFGHYVGSVKNANQMFEQVVEDLADFARIGAETAKGQ
jgi:AcrR family transcriptional regulator